MYVTKALVAGNGGIGSVTEEFVLGALSLVVWTVTLLTTCLLYTSQRRDSRWGFLWPGQAWRNARLHARWV